MCNFYTLIQEVLLKPPTKIEVIIGPLWKYETHINVLESRTLVVGLRWIARQREIAEKRIEMLTDLKAVYYMIERGIAGANRLWRIRIRIGAL